MGSLVPENTSQKDCKARLTDLKGDVDEKTWEVLV
jgi:hypothetical protein